MDNDEADMDTSMAQNEDYEEYEPLPRSASMPPVRCPAEEVDAADLDGDFKERYECRFDGSWSDNNLNEKQHYADQEKEDPVYIDEYARPHPNPFLEIPDPPENLELQSCPICSRNFVPTSLAKHIGICEKMQSKKRKPFDSSRQRREGTELASYLPKNFGLPQNHPQARVSPPKTTNPVRKLSTSKTPTPERKDYSGGGMNNSMSSSQTLASTTPTGAGSNGNSQGPPGSTTPRPILKRSLSQQNEPCPYCERCFGFKAYDRHVEWCREKALLNKNIQYQSSVAKERLQARIQYKAPQLKSKRALNREKYSGSLSCGGSTSSLADLDLPFPRHRSHLNSMSSSLSSDNGYTPDRYDPFLSAKRQLEELFSPTSSYNNSTTRQQTSNSRVTTPVTPSPTAMSKSVVVPANKTSPTINSNFRRASSLRMPRKVSRPMFIEKAKSNIQKGITDDGPVSPNFLKSSEYDEIPIKSVFNAAQMAEKPKMRDSSSTRRNLKLDIKDPNLPATDIPLSKTDSLAVFLKYEHELNLLMSEKEMKDKSNSLSKRSSSLSGHERKDSTPYSPTVIGNGTERSNERTSRDEKEKLEKPVQEIQPIKKLPQKLVPIKLDPINITYNNNTNVNNITSKPTVISLDTILGKSSKPKVPPEEKMVRKESNYIDPKLINKCDNLPITVTKLTKPEVIEVVKPVDIPKLATEPKRLISRTNGTSPETEGGGDKVVTPKTPAADNRLSDISTKSDSSDARPNLIRQNGTASRTDSSSISGDSSREESPLSQPSRNQSRTEDAKSQTPDSGLERSTPKPSTPIAVNQKKPERPPLPSFDDFDFEEFISSFEDERRSFQNAFYSRKPTSNNTSSTSFNQRAISVNNSFTDNSLKSAVNCSNSNTSSPSHFASPNSQSFYKSLNTNGRSEEEDQSPQKPQVPPRRPQPPEPSTIRNLPSIQPVNKPLPGSPGSSPLQPNNPNSIFSYGTPASDISNNNTSSCSPLAKASPSPPARLGSGNTFNNPPITTHLPYQPPHPAPSVPPKTQHTISAQSPSRQQSPVTKTDAVGGGGFLDDLSPTERDLMKSVQELDRMCESSSSMYPADSDEVSSVEGYPLSGSSRDRGHHHHHQRPSEGSKFSADSAYGSLSRQSPQQDQAHTIQRAHHHHHHHRGGAKSSSSTSQQHGQDAFDNSSGSESSLPPITTATLKAQKIELHSHGGSNGNSSGSSMATAAGQMSKFCHECGSRFMINTAKFCMECGVRRILLD